MQKRREVSIDDICFLDPGMNSGKHAPLWSLVQPDKFNKMFIEGSPVRIRAGAEQKASFCQ